MLNKKYKLDKLVTLKELDLFQKTENIEFTSDQIEIFLNYNGLRLDESRNYHIQNDQGILIVGFDQIIPFNRMKEFLYNFKEFENDLNIEILNKMLPFALTYSNIYLMIGCQSENLNKIILWSFEFYDDPSSNEREQIIADNYIDLLNIKLVNVEMEIPEY